MTIQEQIEILNAYNMGEEIEILMSEWLTLENDVDYLFDFQHFKYRVKKKRWRAEEYKYYYAIDSCLTVGTYAERYRLINNIHFDVGNYFRTEEEAKQAKKLLEETLTKFHEDYDE